MKRRILPAVDGSAHSRKAVLNVRDMVAEVSDVDITLFQVPIIEVMFVNSEHLSADPKRGFDNLVASFLADAETHVVAQARQALAAWQGLPAGVRVHD